MCDSMHTLRAEGVEGMNSPSLTSRHHAWWLCMTHPGTKRVDLRETDAAAPTGFFQRSSDLGTVSIKVVEFGLGVATEEEFLQPSPTGLAHVEFARVAQMGLARIGAASSVHLFCHVCLLLGVCLLACFGLDCSGCCSEAFCFGKNGERKIYGTMRTG
jgi:hypothetical protein